MLNPARKKLAVSAVVFALVLCLTTRTTLNATDRSTGRLRGPQSLAETLFSRAGDLSRALHERPLEERSHGDYRRAMDAYGQVIRLHTDAYCSAESLAKMAELQREMADATGDSALYQQSIETYRRILIDHPQSTFVGDALINIAQIYEESLQDLDGAAAAYRELIRHFPSSIMAREASAVLSRFEGQLTNRAVDVGFGPRASGERGGDAAPGSPHLTNVRNFSGPDYARVVIDLSGEAHFVERRIDGGRIAIQLNDAAISSSLYGRRFIVAESDLLKRISVSPVSRDGGSRPEGVGVQVEIEAASISNYTAFRLSDPERIVIDLHGSGVAARTGGSNRASGEDGTPGSKSAVATEPSARRQASLSNPGRALSADMRNLALPEITDPILLFKPGDANSTTAIVKPPELPGGVNTTVESRVPAGAAVKCIVIDPGHGGHDTGTIGTNGMREKDLVLDVARRLRNYIKRAHPDVEVLLTRDSDRYVALEERTAIANARRADLFISVHANASPSRVASGVETYFLSPDRAPAEDLQAAARENARFASETRTTKEGASTPSVVASVTVGNRVAQSRELARYIQAGLVRGIGSASPRTAANRGVKHAPFVVLLGAAMPSVLAEISFVSNPRDEALLQTFEFRERIAASLFAGLNTYLKKTK